MTGLGPVIHERRLDDRFVDGRIKSGHDAAMYD
jgi:hypothetical protein